MGEDSQSFSLCSWVLQLSLRIKETKLTTRGQFSDRVIERNQRSEEGQIAIEYMCFFSSALHGKVLGTSDVYKYWYLSPILTR